MHSLEVYGKTKKPSQELIDLIREIGSSIMNTRSLVQKVKEKGNAEGFNEFEIILLARELLRSSMTRRQMNYWFPIRSTVKGQNAQKVQNIENKNKAQYPVAFVLEPLSVTSQSFDNQRESIATIIASGEPKKMLIEKHRGKNSGIDLNDPKLLDSTSYEQRLHQHTWEKQSSSRNENLEDESSDFFQVSKNCDFINEHYKAHISPSEAVEYLRRYVDKCQRIDFAFRVVE